MGFEDEKTLALRLVSTLIENASRITTPEKMFAALQQIIAFWKIIPLDLRKKAAELFQRIWANKDIAFTTDPEIMKESTTVSFDEPKIEYLYLISPVPRRGALRLGQEMKTLGKRGLEDAVVRVKDKLYTKYGADGLTIGHMITTNDIMMFLEQVESSCGQLRTKEDFTQKKNQILDKFERWVDEYMRFTLFVEPKELDEKDQLKTKIISIAENTQIKLISIHMISSLNNINTLLSILKEMKSEGKINCKEINNTTIEPRGLQYAFSVKLEFE